MAAAVLVNHVVSVTRSYRTEKRRSARETGLDAPEGEEGGVALADPDKPPPQRAAAAELSEAIEQALKHLPPQYRLAIELRHKQDKSFAEIGEALNCSAEAARKLWARAIVRLQNTLERFRE